MVVSRNAALQVDGAERAASLHAALALLHAAPRVFVIGGAEIYAQALPLATELMLTEVDADLPGGIFFPAWTRADFMETARRQAVTADGVGYAFVTYSRRQLPSA